jgi:hypothetical protein
MAPMIRKAQRAGGGACRRLQPFNGAIEWPPSEGRGARVSSLVGIEILRAVQAYARTPRDASTDLKNAREQICVAHGLARSAVRARRGACRACGRS